MSFLASHPCFSGGCGLGKSGRIHLPVSPVCNIRCRFCARGISPDRQCPGNASTVVTPEEAMRILDRARTLCPELAVVGIAGPGDPLASDHALRTLTLAAKRHPDLLPCLSTNGLALAINLPRLHAIGLKTVTVTVNAVDPDILARLCGGITWDGRFISGRNGTRRLIDAQRSGVILASSLGVMVKINLVLVPGVNDGHAETVARTVAEWGASYINIIPLMPAAELANMKAPSSVLVETVRDRVEWHLPVMRHCRRCRADACGVPGVSDFASELYAEFQTVETFSHG